MRRGRKARDPDLLDALDSLERVPYAGESWRVVREGRDPLQGHPSGGRWDPAVFDVLYASLEPDGAIAEVHFHLTRQPVFPSKIRHGLHRFTVATSRTLHFRDIDELMPFEVDRNRYREVDYDRTQIIGDAAYFLGFDSIIAPNARWPCSNLILFTDQIAPGNLEIVSSSEVNWAQWRAEFR